MHANEITREAIKVLETRVCLLRVIVGSDLSDKLHVNKDATYAFNASAPENKT